MAEQQVVVAQNEIDRRRVVAKFTGVVDRIYPQIGEWVTIGDPILNLVGMDRLCVEGYVRGDDFAPHELFAMPVTIEVTVTRGQVERFTSKIGYVSPTVEANGVFRVTATHGASTSTRARPPA